MKFDTILSIINKFFTILVTFVDKYQEFRLKWPILYLIDPNFMFYTDYTEF